jgi:uncharacterized repeat protein (TIGR03837 family)
MSTQAGQRWDIFCRIVDNFGDIGVCWRLSQQLFHEHNLQIRLFIDDLNVASQIIPNLNFTLQSQNVNGIEILNWQSANSIKPADVALECFSCELPAEYLSKMQDSVWINLEYLSAEPWVADFHARSSNNTKPARHFFFPGFTEDTGGLIREAGIFEKNQVIAINQQLQTDFFEKFHLKQTNTIKVSLFCYPHAPIHDLLKAMAESNQAIDCYVPASSILPNIASFFGLDSSQNNEIQIGSIFKHKNLNLHILPFLNQMDYDQLLAICDINFVRGEDSWIRAIWAGKPFIWQPYLQTENTHINKLNAFLDLFYKNFEKPAKHSAHVANSAWVCGNITAESWQNYLDNLHAIKLFTIQQSSQLATQSDLASKLVIFLQKLRVKV